MATRDDDPFPIDGLLTAEELEFLASEPALRRMCGMTPGQRVLGVKARGKGESWKKRVDYCLDAAEKAHDVGEFKRELGAWTLALRLLPRQPDLDADQARLLINIANSRCAQGQPEAARKLEERAWDLLQQPHLADNPALDRHRAILLINNTATQLALQQYKTAREQKEQAQKLLQQPHLLKNPVLDRSRANLLGLEAISLFAHGQLEEAARKLEEAENPALHDYQRVGGLILDALIHHAQRQPEAARKLEERAWDLLQQPHLADNPALDRHRAILLVNSANTRYALEQHEEGLAYLRRAIQQLLDTPDKIAAHWVALTALVAPSLARQAIAGRCPDWPELLAPLSAAFIEVMDLQPESFLAFARPAFIQFHRVYLYLCLHQGRHDLLPEVLRAVQGRKMAALMLEELDQTPAPDPTVKAFRDVRRKLRQMALGLQVLSGGLDGPGGRKGPHGGSFTWLLPGQHAISADEANRRVREYEALLPTYRQLRSELERTGRLPDPKRGRPLTELQQTLHPGQTLALLVHLPDAKSLAPVFTAALLVTATATELVHLENLPQVAYEGQRYSDACRGRGRRQTLTRRAPTDASALADDKAAPSLDDLRRQINESFWEPLRPHLDGITQLTLLPHGDLLHALPYELAAPDTLHLRFYPGLVFYDQALTARGTPLPQPGPNAPLGLRVHPAAETDQPVYLVQAEAELVREVWEKMGATVTNPADLTQASPAWSVFHAASHGDLDPQQPGSAYLLLGPQEHLSLSGVLASPQHPPLVFLSACVVGRLQEDLDGDPLGLVSGFFLKGTRYVVAPLIPVPDHYMPLLGVLFHQAWQSGLDPEAALAEAKRRLREADWYQDTADLARAAYAPVLKQRYEDEHGKDAQHLVNDLVKADLTDFCDPKAVAEAIQKNDFLVFVRGFGDVE